MTFPKLLWFKFFPWLFQAWKLPVKKIPWLFQVFHKRTNPETVCKSFLKDIFLLFLSNCCDAHLNHLVWCLDELQVFVSHSCPISNTKPLMKLYDRQNNGQHFPSSATHRIKREQRSGSFETVSGHLEFGQCVNCGWDNHTSCCPGSSLVERAPLWHQDVSTASGGN